MTERQSDDDLRSVYTAKLYLTSSVGSCQPVASCFQHSHSQAKTTKPRRENFIQSPCFFFQKYQICHSFFFFWQLEFSIWCNGASLRNYILNFNINSLTRCGLTEQSEDQELKGTQVVSSHPHACAKGGWSFVVDRTFLEPHNKAAFSWTTRD